MSDHDKKLGQEGEQLAAQFLEKEGFQILERNYRCRWGEIDLIAAKGGVIHFIEVKSRHSFQEVSPLELVPYPKQLRISRTAQLYWASQKIKDQSGQFSLLVVDWGNQEPRCEFLAGVFELVWGY